MCPAALPETLLDSRIEWPVAAYRDALATLPEALRADLFESWGAVEDDPLVEGEAFHFPALALGKAIVALQPERGRREARADDYHDLSRCPRHSYVAFYLWLRAQGIDALVHVGAHGTLEWLPGKAVALSDACWPEALTRDWPVLYPFIVNDPGEAAQAKRRLGAVTIGHVPPALVPAGTGAGLGRLEALLDEYANADGLDPSRRDRLRGLIAEEAEEGRLCTANAFASKFENKRGLGGKDNIRERIGVLATKGYIKYRRDARDLGQPYTKSKNGYLVVQDMLLSTGEEIVDPDTGEISPATVRVLPSHFQCPRSEALLEVENPEVWVLHDPEEPA